MRKIILFYSILFFSLHSFAQDLLIANTRCENKINPLGIEKSSPNLSWQMRLSQRGILQTGYRILVSDNAGLLEKNVGNIWDTKKVNSDGSIQISYKGKKLNPAATYYWKVMVWDNKKNISKWSELSSWQMGLPGKQGWGEAKWIAMEKLPDSLKIIPALENRGPKGLPDVKDVLPLFRKTFTLAKPVKKATIFLCGLGQFELSINGKKIGDHFLDPGWTQFDKEAQYVTFDVTNQLQEGANAIGVMLGNGFYFIPRQRYRKLTGAFGFPKMICKLVTEFRDGTSTSIVSDGSWKADVSPVTYSGIYGGEEYDANLEQKGWNTSSFNDNTWKNVLIVNGPDLISQMQEPIKIFETFSPQKITKVKDSAWVYDMSQNLSGIISITVSGKKGDTIKVIPGELLNPNGTVIQRATGAPYYFDYILKGDGIETWQPRFSYYGFRYLQVEGSVPKGEANPYNLPVMSEIKSLHTRNAAERVGDFSCSNELFNKTNALIDWSIKSNMQSVLTDCPHREKLGWLEQVHLMGSSVRYNYDVVNLFKKIIHDMQVAQTPEGLIPEISPEYVKFDYGNGMFRNSPEWGSNGIILPWYLYQWYGEKELLKESYPMMQKYIEYLRSKASDNIISQGLGDWYDLGPNPPGVSQLTPMGVTATAIYHYDLGIIAKVASLIGKTADADGYDKLASQVKASFNKKFFHENTKQYATGSQAANAMAVYMGLTEPASGNAVVDNIVKDLAANKNALTAGDIGYRYLLRVLEDAGRSDIIFDMNSRTDVPGYGYQLDKGATSLTESWQALPTVSNNHLMLGHLMEWFYSGLCGIRQSANSIAFHNIEIKPEPVGNITWAKANYHSPYGIISSEWKKQNNTFELDVEIPANTTATIFLPANNVSSITEDNKALENRAYIRFAGMEKGKAKIIVGSGSYKFLVK